MTESTEKNCEVLQDDISSALNSIIDQIDCKQTNITSLGENKLCSNSKDIVKESGLKIASINEVIGLPVSSLDCVHDNILSVTADLNAIMDHNSYCSKTIMEGNTELNDSHLKVDNSDKETSIITVEEENESDKAESPQEDNTNKNILCGISISSLPSSGDSTNSIQTQVKPKSVQNVGITPRATRSSQNPDFAAKHRKFLNSKLMKRDSDSDNSEAIMSTSVKSNIIKEATQRKQDSLKDNISEIKVVEKRKRDSVSKLSEAVVHLSEGDHDACVKKRKGTRNENYQPSVIEGEVDCYCWRCHRDGNVIPCETCPRVYHLRCIQLDSIPSRGWVCPECSTVMHAENIDSRSKAMQMLTLDQLCRLLQFAVNRMKGHEGSEEFAKPVDTQQFQQYRKFIVKPMDLSLLEENIKNNLYGSTEAFLADAKWILHNCVIFNTVQSKFTNIARALLKICRQEMLEIENCPDCYLNAHTRSSDSWFIEACRKPHILVWAKLKGFPFWPAKAMSFNNENQVDVRFFGAHDRAWVPVNACYLYSKMPPVQSTKKKNNLEECIQELEAHIKKLRDKFGTFEHAPYKTPYNPKKEEEQLLLFLPKFDPNCLLSKRVGRLIHDRVRPLNANASPEKSAQITDLRKEKSEVQKEKTDHKSPSEKHDQKQKRKASSSLSPSRDPKAKCLDKASSEELTCKEPEELTMNNEEYDSSSPPKFFISKLGLQKNKVLMGSSNETKIAFVDKLQEKLSRLEKANTEPEENIGKESSSEESANKKSRNEEPLQSVSENKVKDIEKYSDITLIKSVVVLHDLKNNKVLSEKLRQCTNNLETKSNDSLTKDNKVKTTVLGDEEDIIQIDSNSSTSIENEDEGMEVNDDSEKRIEIDKKKNNINNVVETIKERKSSTDGKLNDTNVEKDNAGNIAVDITAENYDKNGADASEIIDSAVTVCCDSSTDLTANEQEIPTKANTEKVLLDSSEYPLVIIDESPEDKSGIRDILLNRDRDILKSCLETSDKPVDKNRRKGKPAKVCSRESIDSDENNRNSRRQSAEVDSLKNIVDSHIESVLDEVSGKFTNCKAIIDSHVHNKFSRTDDETNVTINLHSDESNLNKKAHKEIRASVNLSKDVSLSVLGDSVPSALDMECISDSEEPVLIDENIPSVEQEIRPTARKTLPNPANIHTVPAMKSVNKTPQQRKSTDYIEGIKVRSPQSLQEPMSPPLIPNNDIKRINSSVPLKLQNGHPNINPSMQPMPVRNGQNQCRILPPLLKPNQNTMPMVPGPLNVHLDRLSQKLTQRFRLIFEELLKEMSSEGCTEATVKGLQLEIERMQWRHRQELTELKHNTDLVVMEVRASLESEKQRLLIEAKHKFEQEKEQAIQETKCKQWCAYCRKEALLYCCWNTAYCSYPCQQNHWVQHMTVCAQNSHSPRNDNAKPVMRGNNGPGVLSSSAKAFNMQNPPQMHDAKSDNEFEDVNNSQLEDDFDSNNNDGTVSDSLIKTKAPRRKRCGQCEGCSQLENCQNCRACLNLRSHQVCQKRRCSNLIVNNNAANKKRHGNIKLGSGGFVQLNVPAMNNASRAINPRHFTSGPQFMPMMHHQPSPGGFHHPPPDMSPYHQVFMN